MSVAPTWRLTNASVYVNMRDEMKQWRHMLELHVSNFAESDNGFQNLEEYFLNF